MKYKYKVNGLDCANCTQKLEDSLNKKEEISRSFGIVVRKTG